MMMRTTKYTIDTKGPEWKRFSTEGRDLVPALNWWLEATITGTLGSVPPHCGGRHLCLPVSAASSRVFLWLGGGAKLRLKMRNKRILTRLFILFLYSGKPGHFTESASRSSAFLFQSWPQ